MKIVENFRYKITNVLNYALKSITSVFLCDTNVPMLPFQVRHPFQERHPASWMYKSFIRCSIYHSVLNCLWSFYTTALEERKVLAMTFVLPKVGNIPSG